MFSFRNKQASICPLKRLESCNFDDIEELDELDAEFSFSPFIQPTEPAGQKMRTGYFFGAVL